MDSGSGDRSCSSSRASDFLVFMGIPPSDGCVFYPKKNQPACQAMTTYAPALHTQSLPSYNIKPCEAPMRFTFRPYSRVLVPCSVSSHAGAFLAQPQLYLLRV